MSDETGSLCISYASYYNKNPQSSMTPQLTLPLEQSNLGICGGQRFFIFLILRFSPFWLVADPSLLLWRPLVLTREGGDGENLPILQYSST